MPNFGYDPRDEDGCRCTGFTCTCGAFGGLSTSDVAHPDFERHEAARIREMEGRRPWLPDPPLTFAEERMKSRDMVERIVDGVNAAHARRVVAETLYQPACPYCRLPTALVGGDVVYPHRPDLAEKRFWLCHPCDAYVGCHPGSARPLGTPANADLRVLRSRVHAALDPLWRGGRVRRSEAYERLAVAMGIPGEECHVGMFDEARCRAALAAIRSI